MRVRYWTGFCGEGCENFYEQDIGMIRMLPPTHLLNSYSTAKTTALLRNLLKRLHLSAEWERFSITQSNT